MKAWGMETSGALEEEGPVKRVGRKSGECVVTELKQHMMSHPDTLCSGFSTGPTTYRECVHTHSQEKQTCTHMSKGWGEKKNPVIPLGTEECPCLTNTSVARSGQRRSNIVTAFL